MDAIMQAFAYYTNPAALSDILTTTTCKTSSCLINALSPLINDLADDVTINMITAFTQSYATNVLSLSAADLQEVNAFIASYAALSAKLLELQNRKRTTLPVSTAVVLSSAVIGQRLIASDLPFYIDNRNRGPLGESIAQNLKGYGNIESVNASSVRYALSIGNDGNVTGISVSFTYFMICLPQTTCALSTSEQTSVKAMMNHVIESYDLRYASCFTVESGFDFPCLQNKVTQKYKDAIAGGATPDEAKAIAIAYFKELYGCGVKGADAEGKCIDPTASDAADIAAKDAADTAETIAAQDSTSGSDGGFPIIIIAAAGGGVLLCVVIIIIVAARRRRSKPRKAASTRDPTVVAFENPMYEDNNLGGKSKPDALYDNGVSGGGNGSEGLYDEPANNPAGLRSVAKQNPVYASSEHLYNDEDEHNATGYLDVGADQ